MNRRNILKLTAITVLGLVGLSVSSPTVWAADPSVAGTWEFNAGKSNSTDPLFQSHTRVYEVEGQQETMTGTGVNAQGQPINFRFTVKVDGKDYPFQFPGADAINLTRVDALTVNFVNKKDGKPVVTGTRVLSADGKVMTIVSKGTNSAGKPLDATWVFERR